MMNNLKKTTTVFYDFQYVSSVDYIRPHHYYQGPHVSLFTVNKTTVEPFEMMSDPLQVRFWFSVFSSPGNSC